MNSSKNPDTTCDDLCVHDRKITTFLLALLVVTCALPALAFHGESGTPHSDNRALTFLRGLLQPQQSPMDDL